jgi:hypothetical protein
VSCAKSFAKGFAIRHIPKVSPFTLEAGHHWQQGCCINPEHSTYISEPKGITG